MLSVSRGTAALFTPFKRATFHTQVANRLIELGLAGFLFAFAWLSMSASTMAQLSAFVVVVTFVSGAGLYFPMYFIGQELIDSGGVAVILFAYICTSAITYSMLVLVLLSSVEIQLMVYLIFGISVAGLWHEVKHTSGEVV